MVNILNTNQKIIEEAINKKLDNVTEVNNDAAKSMANFSQDDQCVNDLVSLIKLMRCFVITTKLLCYLK